MSARERNEPISISDSIHDVLRSMRDDGGRSPVSASAVAGVFGRWVEAVGDAVAAHVQPVTLDGTTLVVKVDDPSWATQLRFLERTLRERLAEVAGVEVEHLEIRVAGRSGDRRREP
ncbi:MAG: DciA family protein [Ilumatobacteraceae bacterium]